MTKSKLYFSIPVLLLLVVDQSYKFQIEFIQKEKKKSSKQIEKVNTYEKIRKYTNAVMITLIVIGSIHYTIRQYKHFGSKFSFINSLYFFTLI